jgi:hypothetical protein
MFENDSYRSPLRKYRATPGPIPTLGELVASGCDWLWLECNRRSCSHRMAVRLAPFIAKYGAGVSSNLLRRNTVCTSCGHKGASTFTPRWIDLQQGIERFPAERALRAIGIDLQ